MTRINICYPISEVELRNAIAKVQERWSIDRMPSWLAGAKIMAEIKIKKNEELNREIN